MGKLKIKMIAMDFDSTLIDNSYNKPWIHPSLIELLKSFIEQGGYAGIVTGRRIYEMELLFQIMQIPWRQPFPNFLIHRESYAEFSDLGLSQIWDKNNEIAHKRISRNMYKLGEYAGEWETKMGKQGLNVRRWNLYGDFSLEYAMENEKQAHAAISFLEKELINHNLTGYYAHRNTTLATVIDGKAGKGNILKEVGNSLGLKSQEILAIGDSLNDIPMLNGSRGFVSACVGNADSLLIDMVQKNNGYIGKGVASESIIDIISQLKEEGML